MGTESYGITRKRPAPIWIFGSLYRRVKEGLKKPAPLHVVRGQHGPASGRQEIGHLADARKLPNQRSVEPSIHGFLVEDLERLGGGKGFPVRTIVDQSIIDVRHLQNARFEWDFSPIQ